MKITYEVWLWSTQRGIMIIAATPDKRVLLTDHIQAICDKAEADATLTLGTTIKAFPKDAKRDAERWFDSLSHDARVVLFSSMADGIKERIEQHGVTP